MGLLFVCCCELRAIVSVCVLPRTPSTALHEFQREAFTNPRSPHCSNISPWEHEAEQHHLKPQHQAGSWMSFFFLGIWNNHCPFSRCCSAFRNLWYFCSSSHQLLGLKLNSWCDLVSLPKQYWLAILKVKFSSRTSAPKDFLTKYVYKCPPVSTFGPPFTAAH